MPPTALPATAPPRPGAARRPRHRHALLGGAAVLALAASLLGTPAGAHDDEPEWHEVASGLDNPRQLTVHRDALYVAEAGVGGAGPCMAGPEGAPVCFGATGAITRVSHDDQERVARRLPSLAEEGGFAAIGPSDVAALRGRTYAVTIGLGADPAVRADLPRLGRRLMGTIAKGRWDHGLPRRFADLARYEARTDKDDAGPDSNPTGLLWHRGRFLATDSGANTLVRAGLGGRVKALAVFDSPGTEPSPFDPSEEIEVQPVPTAVAMGPDGAFYISELTGFPFVPGLSRIHRMVPGMPPTVYATGLTNVTDLAWHDDELYAVQIADEGLLSAEEGELPDGSLVRVDSHDDDHERVGDQLPAPYGLAIKHDRAYVSACAVCPDDGVVMKIDLDD
jgi:hypothetical protein